MVPYQCDVIPTSTMVGLVFHTWYSPTPMRNPIRSLESHGDLGIILINQQCMTKFDTTDLFPTGMVIHVTKHIYIYIHIPMNLVPLSAWWYLLDVLQRPTILRHEPATPVAELPWDRKIDWKWPIETVALPINRMVILPLRYVNVDQAG